jgi:hypothetical protein
MQRNTFINTTPVRYKAIMRSVGRDIKARLIWPNFVLNLTLPIVNAVGLTVVLMIRKPVIMGEAKVVILTQMSWNNYTSLGLLLVELLLRWLRNKSFERKLRFEL